MKQRIPRWAYALVVALAVLGAIGWTTERRERERLLFEVSAAGNPQMVRSLLKSGLSVNARDRRYKIETPRSSGLYWSTRWRTPLHYAAESGGGELVGLLIEAGANVNATALDGHTPLMLAAEWQEAGLIRQILAAGANANVRDRLKGNTALHVAASRGETLVLGELLAAGADPNAANLQGATPLCQAVANGHLQATKLLLKHGATVHIDEARPLLLLAAQAGDPEIVRLLLAHGSDARELNLGVNALQRARSASQKRTIRLLQLAQERPPARPPVPAHLRPAPWEVTRRGWTHWDEAAEEKSVTVALPLALLGFDLWLLLALWRKDGLQRFKSIEGLLPLRGRWLRMSLTALLVLLAVPLCAYAGILLTFLFQWLLASGT